MVKSGEIDVSFFFFFYIFMYIFIHQLEVVAKTAKENVNTDTIAASSMSLHHQFLTLFTTQLAPWWLRLFIQKTSKGNTR